MNRIFFLLLIPVACCGQTPDRNHYDLLLANASIRKDLLHASADKHLKLFDRGSAIDLSVAREPIAGRAHQASSIRSYGTGKYKPRERYLFIGLTSGAWVPMGRNRILGDHASTGIVMGKWSGQWMWEVEMEFRYLRAAHPYKVMYMDSLQSIRNYFGGFIGLHVGYGFLNFKSTSVYILAGGGFDGFDAIEGDDCECDDSMPSLTINSFNVNAGLGMQHFGKRGGYWALELLYNKIRYKNPGGSPLDGDALTLRLTIGLIGGY